jgi:hypothetical protein
VRPVKYSGLSIQVDCDPGSCPLLGGSSKPIQKGFDITPFDIPRNGLGKDGGQNPRLLPIHDRMIASGAIGNKLDFGHREMRRTDMRTPKGKEVRPLTL